MEEENRPDNCPPCPVCEERLKKEEEKKENTGFFGRLFGVGKKAEEGLQETQDKAVEAVKAQGDKAKEGIKDLGRKSGEYARALVGMEPVPAVEETAQAEASQEGGKKHRRKHKKHTKKHYKSNLKKSTKSKKAKNTKKVRFAKRK